MDLIVDLYSLLISKYMFMAAGITVSVSLPKHQNKLLYET